eukprot:6287933-Pyramimonas_sp.AAC.1
MTGLLGCPLPWHPQALPKRPWAFAKQPCPCHRLDVCFFSRRGPSRSILDHLANKNTHETEKNTGNGRPSYGQALFDSL